MNIIFMITYYCGPPFSLCDELLLSLWSLITALDVRQRLIEFIDSLSGKYGSVAEGTLQKHTLCAQ